MKPKVMLTAQVPRSLVERLTEQALAAGKSRSQLVREALTAVLQREPVPKQAATA